MKIAVYLYGLSGGGATRRTLALAGAWVGLGHAVDLLVIDVAGPLAGKVPAGVCLIELAPVLPPWLARSRRRKLLAAIPRVAGYLTGGKPDIFLSAANHAHLSALLAARLAGVDTPTIIRVSNHLTESHRRSGERWRLAFARRCYGWADAAIGVSKGISRDLSMHITALQKRVYSIPNPTFTPEIEQQAGLPLPETWDRIFASGGPVILAAGRFTPQKDFPTLLRAFALLRRQRAAKLVILGEGKQRKRLERMCSELGLDSDVFLPGYMENPYAWMARADLFVLSSAWEGSPGVLIEAMACGCPVVSTRCPSGPEEILEDGRLGPLVPVGDAAAMAAAMARTLAEPPATSLLVSRAGQFSVQQAARDYLSVFMDLHCPSR